MTMGEKIKTLRLEKGLTLEEVGARVGVGKSTVRKWETGQIANMRRDKIALLADALGVSPQFLMGWDEPKEAPETATAKLTAYINALDEEEAARVYAALEDTTAHPPEDVDFAQKAATFEDVLKSLQDPAVPAAAKNALLHSIVDHCDYWRAPAQMGGYKGRASIDSPYELTIFFK